MAQSPLTFSKPSPDADPAERPFVFSVSGLIHRMRRQLENAYPDAYVGGEISNFQINPGSGHAYFTLKDQRAKLSCVMWRDNLRHLKFRPQRGMEVILRGRITIYERGGQLQMNVLHVEPQGLGALKQEFDQRLAKLKAEGLTDRARPLPRFPRAIGIVTSKGGAALRDIVRTILRRDPAAHLIISGAQVQGRSSAFSVVSAIERLDRLQRVDLIIVARGGGSAEELWAFNEEPVARAIFACSVPVMTGIGHEIDTTIADYVADARAATPTAAAERAIPVRAEVEARFAELSTRLGEALHNRLHQLGRRLLSLEMALADPTPTLQRRAQYLDELSGRAERNVTRRLAAERARLTELEATLNACAPHTRVLTGRARLAELGAALTTAYDKRITAERQRHALLAGRLDSLSPLAVLARGYAIATNEAGRAVRRPSDVQPGDALRIRLAEGEIAARVEGEDPDE